VVVFFLLVNRLCYACQSQDTQVAIRSDQRFQRLVENVQGKMAVLSPQHMADVMKSLNELGANLDGTAL